MDVTVVLHAAAPGRLRASCAALPGCVVEAATKAEAWRRITIAAEGYVASLDAATRLRFREPPGEETDDATMPSSE
jgi:predicted RNase H-like HicB family nuclease